MPELPEFLSLFCAAVSRLSGDTAREEEEEEEEGEEEGEEHQCSPHQSLGFQQPIPVDCAWSILVDVPRKYMVYCFYYLYTVLELYISIYCVDGSTGLVAPSTRLYLIAGGIELIGFTEVKRRRE